MQEIFIDYRIWAISSIIFNIFLASIFLLIYKKTSHEFHQFTKKRIIADIIIFFLVVLSQVINLFQNKLDFSQLYPDNKFMYIGFFVIVTVVGLIVSFYTIHLLVCSVINIYQTFRNKLFKKNKKEFIISWAYIILLNGYTKAVIELILLLFITPFVHPLFYEPCGFEVTNFTTPSSAMEAGMKIDEIILKIDNKDVLELVDFEQALASKKPNDKITVGTSKGTYDVTLGADPKDNSKSFLGVIGLTKFCEK